MYYEYNSKQNISSYIAWILTIFLGLGIWVPAVLGLYNCEDSYIDSYFYKAIYNIAPTCSKIAQIATLSIIIIQSVVIYFTNYRYNLKNKKTLIIVFFYLFTTGIFSAQNGLSPALLSSTFLIISYIKILNIQDEQNVELYIFEAFIHLAIASLFTAQAILLIPFYWAALIIFKQINLRNIFASILGFLSLYFIIGAIFYLSDGIDIFNQFITVSLNDLYIYKICLPKQIIEILILLFTCVYSVIIYSGKHKYKLYQRNYISFNVLMLIANCIIILLFDEYNLEIWACIFISTIASFLFSEHTSKLLKIWLYILITALSVSFIFRNFILLH